MFLRLLQDSFLRRRRAKLLTLLALALGTGVTMATISVALDIGDQVGRELRSFGANILVRPQADTLPLEIGGVDLRPLSEGSFLQEDQLPRLKAIFWRHHILSFAPFLFQSATLSSEESVVLVGTWFEKRLVLEDGEVFLTGLKELNPSWKLEGSWPTDGVVAEALVGSAVAERHGWQLGEQIPVTLGNRQRATLHMRGRLRTGGDEDRQIFVPLAWLQQISETPNRLRRLQVSALISPEDDFARRPLEQMTPEEFDRWYCTPYVSSIAHQIEEVLENSRAVPVRRVAQAESAILSRVERLLAVVSIAALAGAVLVVFSSMTSSILERRSEIALMKALGAGNLNLSALFLAEAGVLGLVGGALGYGAGLAGARWIAYSIFGATVAAKPVLLPAMVGLAIAVAFIGTLVPLRTIQRTQPALALGEN